MSKSKEVSTDWKAALKQQVAEVMAAKPDTTGIPQISLAGGRMSLNDQYIPGDSIQCIILASTLERAWYNRAYNPEDTSPPDCFSLGENERSMVPHVNVPVPPAKSCEACEWSNFGTATQGAGPACKKRMRLLVMPVPDNVTADMITSPEAEVALYKIQPTSVVKFEAVGGAGKAPGYKKQLGDKGMTPWSVITKISVRPHKKWQHESVFELVRPLKDNDLMAAVFARLKEAEDAVNVPYLYPELEEGVEVPEAPEGDSVDGTTY